MTALDPHGPHCALAIHPDGTVPTGPASDCTCSAQFEPEPATFEPVRHPDTRDESSRFMKDLAERGRRGAAAWLQGTTERMAQWEAENPAPEGMRWAWEAPLDLDRLTAAITPTLVPVKGASE